MVLVAGKGQAAANRVVDGVEEAIFDGQEG